MLVGTVCNDDACAKMLAQAGIIQSLIELLNGKIDSFLCMPTSARDFKSLPIFPLTPAHLKT